MSRSGAALLPITVAALLSGSQALAQAAPGDAPGRAAIEASRVFTVSTARRRCGVPDSKGEIVVCAPDNGADQRIPPTSETDPDSRAALRDGRPHAPQFDKGYCAKCAHFGKVPPPVYYFDIKALPEAPVGSDAERIAKGEQPAP